MCAPHIHMCGERKDACLLVDWSEGAVVVLPVAIRSAAFCVRWSFSMCVVAVSGDQAVWACVSMGLMNCLYSVVMSSLECP